MLIMITRLKEILTIQSESYGQWRMFAYLVRTLTKLNVKFYVLDGNIYATKGKAKHYPCVVAHMDTVHDIAEDLTLIEVGDLLTGFNRVTMTQTGIGGDDKVGIYLALEVLRKFPNVKVAFFRDEEVGCQGSYNAHMDFFRDCSFVLQGDRRGNNDFVTTACGNKLSSKDFKKTMGKIWSKYGYKGCDNGGMTDVMALKEEGLSVSCANISCGYYNPHFSNEYVSTSDVTNCLNMMFEIVKLHGNTPFPHTPERTYATITRGYSKYDYLYDEYDYKKDWGKKVDDTPSKAWWEEEEEGDRVYGKTIGYRKLNDDGSIGEFVPNVGKGYCDACTRETTVSFCTSVNGYLCEDCVPHFK